MTLDFCTEAISHTLRCAWACPELTAALDSCSACLPHLRLGVYLRNMMIRKLSKTCCYSVMIMSPRGSSNKDYSLFIRTEAIA